MSEPPYVEDALLALAFSVRANPGAYAVLLGAGVSAPSGIPTAWGVLQDLTARVALLVGEEPEDPVSWYASREGKQPRYETLLQRLAPTALERQRLLREYFEPTQDDLEAGRKGPTAAHRALARMVRSGSIRVILTLNFDRLMEQAVRAEGVEPTVIASPADVKGMAPLHTLNCAIIHLHGDYLNPTSMLNTIEELQTYHPSTQGLLRRVNEDYGLVIAGWSSVYDPALRTAITAHYPARLSLVWIEPGPVSDQATQLRTSKKGLLFPSDADTGFGRLADAVEALARRDARHPLTVPVAVETAKRELSGQQVSIGLHDTLSREFGRLHDHPDFHLPDYQTDTEYGGYEAILDRVQEAAKVCCALVGTVAYWGDDATDQWWVEELTRFSAHARGGGLSNLLTLRLIAGSALYYAAGVAAVAARRYGLLGRLLTQQRPHPYNDGQQLLAGALGADTAYGAASGRSLRLSSYLRPLLSQSLALNEQAIDDSWQMFEVLRLASVAASSPGFADKAAGYQRAAADLADEEVKFNAAEQAGVGVDDARERRANASKARGRALGAVADLVPLGRPHLLVADRGVDRYRSLVAARLVREIDTEGSSHPLDQLDLLDSPEDLAIAVLAVSLAAGRVGHELAWRSASGVIPMEVWLDSGQAP